MLEAEGIAFRYGPRLGWVLQDISLAVAPGEVIGLAGPSGRGQTTLARILGGYVSPTAGRVTLDGRSLPTRGYCPVQVILQHPELAVNPRWRIEQVLREAERPDAQLLADLGVDRAWMSRWPHELSGGELQRVAVARALGSQTRYVVADEMTAMLDTITQAQLWQAVLSYGRQRALGIIVISHNGPLLDRLCTRVVELPEQVGAPTAPVTGVAPPPDHHGHHH
jgi:peptide/nickel transport system ATP-binding protein